MNAFRKTDLTKLAFQVYCSDKGTLGIKLRNTVGSFAICGFLVEDTGDFLFGNHSNALIKKAYAKARAELVRQRENRTLQPNESLEPIMILEAIVEAPRKRTISAESVKKTEDSGRSEMDELRAMMLSMGRRMDALTEAVETLA